VYSYILRIHSQLVFLVEQNFIGIHAVSFDSYVIFSPRIGGTHVTRHRAHYVKTCRHPRNKRYIRCRKIKLLPSLAMVQPMAMGITQKVLFCSSAVFDPRVGHTMNVLSPFISVLCYSDWLFHGEFCPRLDVVHPCYHHESPGILWESFTQDLIVHSGWKLTNSQSTPPDATQLSNQVASRRSVWIGHNKTIEPFYSKLYLRHLPLLTWCCASRGHSAIYRATCVV